MVQLLRAATALVEDAGSLHSTYMVAQKLHGSGDEMLSSDV